MKPTKMRNKQIYYATMKTASAQLSGMLSKNLRKKYGKRSVRIVEGDSVKVVRGEFNGVDGKVTKVSTSNNGLTIEGVKKEKLKGEKYDVYVHTSNIEVTALNTDDKWRINKLEGKNARTVRPESAKKDISPYSAAAVLPNLLGNHGLIKAAQSDLDAANERKREALGAWFPNLVVGSHWAYEANTKAPGSADSKLYARGLDLTATQLLWDFGGANAGVRIADLTHNIAEDNLEVARQDLLLRAITAYPVSYTHLTLPTILLV